MHTFEPGFFVSLPTLLFIHNMFSRLKRYPLSIVFCLIVLYLSFFRPPSTGMGRIPHLDKVVHFGMYFSMSALLWYEYWRRHRHAFPFPTAWCLAFVFPVLLSGCIELLQEYCTSYRGGEWLDFLANSLGAGTASVVIWLVIRKWGDRGAGEC